MEYKIENVEIVKIYKQDKNRDGKPYMSSKGNPFVKVDIYIDAGDVDNVEFEGKMSYFDYFNTTKVWKPGDRITGIVVQNGKYWNFDMPSEKQVETKKRQSQMDEVIARLDKMETAMIGAGILLKKNEVEEAIDFSKEVLDEKKEEEEEDNLPF